MNTPLSQLDCHIIEAENTAAATIIWLHGLGATAHDFDDIIPYLRTNPTFRGLRFIFPQAPMQPITLNQGFVMPAWYDIYQLDKHGPQDENGIEDSCLHIIQIIEEQIAQGMPAEKIFLVGFSQGGAMALYASLSTHYTLAGVIGLSSYLPLIDQVSRRAVNINNKYWLAHGTHDNVVPFVYGEESANILMAMGCQVDFTSYPIAHEISLPEIKAMSEWIEARLQYE